MVKQRENGRVVGIKVRVVFGDPVAALALPDQSTAYIEQTQKVGKEKSNRPLRPARMLAIWDKIRSLLTAWKTTRIVQSTLT